MAERGRGRARDASDLPPEVLSALPSDPYEQIEISKKIVGMAVASRLSQLEKETEKLRGKLGEKEEIVHDLENRVRELEQALHDSSSRLSQALDEQANLTIEKNNLAASVKKLTRDVAKLETFKRALMQSLQEDDETTAPVTVANESQMSLQDSSASMSFSMKETDTAGFRDYRNSVGSARAVSLKYSSLQRDELQTETDVSKTMLAQAYSLTPPRLTPQLSPSASPKKQSGESSPRHSSSSGSPKQHSINETRRRFSSSQPSSERSTAPNSPPKSSISGSRTPGVDGKEFFRQARNRLSYEQFSAFLANIKELNAHKQSREETLRKAEEIFGSDNNDLYLSFEGLLTRHLPA